MTTDSPHPEEILRELALVHEEKDADYGAAWQTVGELLHAMAGGETVTLETPMDHIRFGLYYERLIKIQRAFNGEFLVDEGEMNHESVRDSHEDDGVYAAMHASTHDGGAVDGA